MYDVGVFIIPECESVCVVVDLQQTMDWSGFSIDKWRHTQGEGWEGKKNNN